MLYEAYISSEAWRHKREERLALDGHRCRLCDHEGELWRLEVHHRPSSYEKIPNESVTDDLITLCARCHLFATDAIRGDRYTVRQQRIAISVQVSDVSERREMNYGVATSKLQVDVRQPDAHAQRPECRPPQPMVPGHEADQRQTPKDGR